jgi:hypothetical protein
MSVALRFFFFLSFFVSFFLLECRKSVSTCIRSELFKIYSTVLELQSHELSLNQGVGNSQFTSRSAMHLELEHRTWVGLYDKNHDLISLDTSCGRDISHHTHASTPSTRTSTKEHQADAADVDNHFSPARSIAMSTVEPSSPPSVLASTSTACTQVLRLHQRVHLG